MRVVFTILILSFFPFATFSQQPIIEPAAEINMNELESAAEDEETESENDYDLQQLNYFIKHPIDINGDDLDQLPQIDALLVNNLSTYRKLLGDLIDLHELQAVPGFTIEIIKSLMPYVTVKKDDLSFTRLRERLTKGEHSILIRPSVIPEIANGYSSTSGQQFAGSRSALFLRYKYQFRNLLQYGFIAEKDAGEKFLTDRRIPDFTSFHFFTRRVGIIKSIAIGDYTINLGQGLIHSQSQAFHKTSSVLNIKRQSEVLRPYHSAGEFNFHRGFACTLSKQSSEITIFYSRRNLTANVEDSVITSINTSGLHRTEADVNDRNRASLSSAGSAVIKKFRQGHFGVNCVFYKYSLPVSKRDELFNLYSIKGKAWRNYSADYSFTSANFHVFGEVAADARWRLAYINGVISSLSRTVDLCGLFRCINKSFQSIYGNAFTENTLPANEFGFYYGVSIKPHMKWRIDLYADLFSFPWLKYRLDAPAVGYAYLMQLTWKPDKLTEVYTRLRYRMKPLNIENDEDDFTVPGIQTIQHWRTHFSYQLSRVILLRSRIEVSLFTHQFISTPGRGYLFYTDIVCKPRRFWLSGNLRFQAFEADNYDSRIYAYENDLMFVSSSPSFYNSGIRCYMNCKAKAKVKFLINSTLTASLKVATTVYNNSSVGTGPAKIPGNRVSVIKMQIFLSQ